MSAVQLLTEHLALWSSADTEKKSGRGRASGNAASVYGIKKLRELILELAVRGKVVPQNDSDEPARELINRIQEEKSKQIADGEIKKSKPLAEITDDDKLFELPNGWGWVRLGDMSEIERGGSPRPIQSFLTNDEDGLNWIKISDTEKGGKYITSTSEKIRKEGLSKTRMVYPDDFLLTNSMSFGRPYISKIEGCIHDGWLRISPPKTLDKDFLYLLLSSPYVAKAFKALAAGAVVLNLNADKVRELLIPIPPLAEQHRIVAKVDELMALCDQLENQHTDSTAAHEKLVSYLLDTLTQSQDAADFNESWQRIAANFEMLFTTESSIDALKQTLLQLAVMGKLVPQDASDEPAIELLTRIQAEKAKLVAEGKIKKSKPLADMTDDEKPFELPLGWEWARLVDVTDGMDSGWSPACLDNKSQSEEVWGVLKTTAVQTMQYLEDENKQLPEHLIPRLDAEVQVGDILFTRAGPMNRVAISCLVKSTRPKLMISDKIIRFHPIEIGVDGQFLALCLNAGATATYLENAKSGMAASQVNISQEKLRLAPIPLPSKALQQRIIAKVDELSTLCDMLKTHIIAANQLQQKIADVMVEQAVG